MNKKIITSFAFLILSGCASDVALSTVVVPGGDVRSGFDCVTGKLHEVSFIEYKIKTSLSSSSVIKYTGEYKIPYTVTFQRARKSNGYSIDVLFEYLNPKGLGGQEFNEAIYAVKDPWEDAIIECQNEFK